jgi:hypothetical protein
LVSNVKKKAVQLASSCETNQLKIRLYLNDFLFIVIMALATLDDIGYSFYTLWFSYSQGH